MTGPVVPRADLAEVDLAERDALGRRAAHEDLVRGVELVARDGPLDDGNPEVARERDERVARDALQDRRRGRRDDRAVLHEEQVLARAFGHVALRVEHDGLVEAQPHGFGLREEAVRVAAADLGLRHRDVRVVAREGRDVRAHAFLESLGPEVVLPLPRGDADRRRAAVEVQVPAAAGAAAREIEERPDVAVVEPVAGDELGAGLDDLLLGERKLPEAEAVAPSGRSARCAPSRRKIAGPRSVS